MDDLDGYWLQSVLAELSAVRSSLVLDFFLSRLEYSSNNSDRSYRVCYMRPYHAVELRLKDAPDAESSMARLLNWMGEHAGNVLLQSEAGEMFVSLFGAFDDRVIAMLSEQFITPSPDRLRIVIAIVAHADRTFVFAQRSIVISMLEIAATLSRELADEAISALYRSAISGVSGGIPGQPSSADLYLKQEAEKVLAEIPRFSIAYRLYDGLRRHAEQSADIARAMHGTLFDDEEE